MSKESSRYIGNMANGLAPDPDTRLGFELLQVIQPKFPSGVDNRVVFVLCRTEIR